MKRDMAPMLPTACGSRPPGGARACLGRPGAAHDFCHGPAQPVEDATIKRETANLRQTGADLRGSDADCALVLTPHPLTVQGQRALSALEVAMLPGETLASLLQRHGVVTGRQWCVSLGGIDVPEGRWHLVRPKHGHLIEARRVPQGGGSGDILRTVAMIAIAVAAAPLAASLGATMGLSAVGVSFLQAGLVLAGTALVNTLLPPKQPSQTARQLANNSVNPTYSLSGGRNRARQFEPMGLVLGQPYCVPDLAAQPYTYFDNGEQHLWQLFHAGINCASVGSLRIGQTPIENYQGVRLGYEGFAAGNTGLPLLSNVDTIAGALLDAPGGAGGWVTRTGSVNTIELALDIEGSLYSVNSSSGAYESLACTIQIEYRPVGGAWAPFVGGVSDVVLSNASTQPLRLTYRLQVAAGQYEVRARKITANATASNQQNQVQWSTLKSYQVDAGSYKGQARLGVQVQASGQLNGSLDEVNWVATAKPMPYWDGTAWTTATSRANGLSNPGALILLLARGIYDEDGRLLAGVGLPDTQIDIDSLKGFMVWCAAKGFTFDYFLQEVMSLDDLIDAIAAAGMGAKSWHTGRLGVIWFSGDQPVESVLNMGTIKAKSFSVDYNTQATADEIEFQYFDRDRNNTWKSIRVLAPGVTTPSSTARQPLTGVTTEAHAAVLARFHMGQNAYQRKTINSEVDLEHLTFRRGTVMALSHDLTQWGYSGRVQAAVNAGGTVTLTLDDTVPAVGPGGAVTRYMGLRIPGESQYRIFPVQAFTGTSRTLTLASAWPGGVPLPGDSADNPAWDTIWIYDFKATPGQKVRVASVVPGSAMSGAGVTMVPETPEFWDYVWNGDYTPPPNTSLLQGPPVVTAAVVTEQLARQGNTYYTELTCTFSVIGSYEQAELWGAVGSASKQLLARTTGTRFNWRGGLDESWSLEVRAFSSLHAGTPYPLSYSVIGLRAPPPDVKGFSIDGTSLSWDTITGVPDLAGYQIRFQYGINTWWPTATPLHRGILVAAPYAPDVMPKGTVTLLIKAVDTTGNESASPGVIVTNMGDTIVANLLESWSQAPTFGGTITNGTVEAGALKANATDLFFGPDAEPFFGPDTDLFYAEATFDQLIYEFKFITPAEGRLWLTHVIDASQFNIEYLRGNTSAFFGLDQDYFFGADTDPFFGPENSWATWPGGLDVVEGEEIGFRVTCSAGAVQGVISELTAMLDVPDVVETLDDVPISAAGTRLPITKKFRVIKNVQTTLQADGGSAVSTKVLDKNATLGPLTTALNSTGSNVAGKVDAVIQGY